jgi:uncharacterized membrane protein
MESSSGGRCSEIGSDLAVIFITVVQLVFLTRFYQVIAWSTTQADGSVTRESLLTADYFTWLPFPVVASIVVIVALIATMIFPRYWFRQAAWIAFCLIGITVTLSLLIIFPFDFSVIPNATAADVVPKALTVFLILWALMYAVAALFLFRNLRRHAARQDNSKTREASERPTA